MANEKVVKFERASLAKLIGDIEERGPKSIGVIAITYDAEGHAHFRISGFTGAHSKFIVLGLLDWIKADLLSDMLGAAIPE